MAGFGTLLGLNYIRHPTNLTKMLHYSRMSLKFIGKFILTLIITLIPLVVFMNPLWNKIQTDTLGKALIKWACQNVALFMGTFFIVYVAPEIAHKCGLEEYKTPTSYTEFTQYEAVKMEIDIQEFIQSPRETELIAPKTSDLGSKFNL